MDGASTAISPSFRSLISTESSAPWETPRKQPYSSTHCSYPQLFCNPVSDCENIEPDHPQKDSFMNPESSFLSSTINHQGSPVVEEASTNQSNSTSGDEMLVDVERSSETEVGRQHERCGVCRKLLSQKSPWCSYKILKCGDFPASGVLPCHHVYHVECLDKVNSTAQTRDPPCPICSNTIGEMEQPLIVPETLEVALRSLRRSHTTIESETLGSLCNDNERRQIRRRNQKWVSFSCCLNTSFSSSHRNPT